jgi:hypothetical protein
MIGKRFYWIMIFLKFVNVIPFREEFYSESCSVIEEEYSGIIFGGLTLGINFRILTMIILNNFIKQI